MTAGAVLTGGSSRRMGTDKAFVEVDGVPMAERVAAALSGGGCSPVSYVGGDVALLARFGRTVHADRFPGAGPLGGVLTALAALGDVLVAACDLPLLDAATVTRLLVAARAAPDAPVIVARTDRVEPALAVWRTTAVPAIEAHWAAGGRALHGALDVLDVVTVPVEVGAMRNVNTLAELSATPRHPT